MVPGSAWQTGWMTHRLGGLVVSAILAVSCTQTFDQLGPSEGSRPSEPSHAIDEPAQLDEITTALSAGVMPNVVGWDLNELGDGTGVLYEIHAVIGLQVTRSIASDAIPVGVIAAQHPAPGTPLDQIDGEWTLDVSDGGPLTSFDELPPDVANFAQTLDGFERNELIIMRSTAQGVAYKTDDWLFGLECAAVKLAYRTFLDGDYLTACPRQVGYVPVD